MLFRGDGKPKLFAFFHDTEYSRKSQRVFVALFLAYFLIGAAILFLDVGTAPWSHAISDLGRAGIPSIKGTAEITSSPASSEIVLSIAWLWGLVMYAPTVWLLTATSCRAVDWDHWRRLSVVIRIGLFVFSLSGIFVLAHMVPTDSAGLERIIFNLLSASALFAVFWGITIWAMVWIGLVMLTIGIIGLVKNFN